MPAETHRHGSGVTPEEIAELLWSLVEDSELDPSEAEGRSLAELGIDAVAMLDLWEAVCGEFGERSLGPEFGSSLLENRP